MGVRETHTHTHTHTHKSMHTHNDDEWHSTHLIAVKRGLVHTDPFGQVFAEHIARATGEGWINRRLIERVEKKEKEKVRRMHV